MRNWDLGDSTRCERIVSESKVAGQGLELAGLSRAGEFQRGTSSSLHSAEILEFPERTSIQ